MLPRRSKVHGFCLTLLTTISTCLIPAVITGCTPFGKASRKSAQAENQQPALVRKIVVLRKEIESPAAVASAAESEHGGTKGFVFNAALKGFSISLSATGAEDLAKDPRVAYMVDDIILKNTALTDPELVQTPQAETIPQGISRSLAINTRSFEAQKDVDATVVVMDTGIDLTHPDLNVTESVSFVGDSSRGNDVYGHGTHVAGIIGAKFNDQGIVGVAPGVKLWAVKVLGDDGSGYLSQIIAGIEYVTQNAAKIDVVNMSFGGTSDMSSDCGNTEKDPYHEAICNSVAKGVVYVAAAGNNAADGGNFLPAAYPEVISVSAIVDTDGLPGGKGSTSTRGADDNFANFSNFGSVVDIAAPGTSILSTYPGGKYAKLSGTSMAAPHVAGAAALYIARNRAQKPTASAELTSYAQKVAAAITSNGIKSGDTSYFTGDPDRYPEPLLNVERLDPKIPPTLTVTLNLDKPAYQLGSDSTANLSLKIADESGAGVSALTLSSFKFDLAGSSLTSEALSLKESTTTPGTWTGSLNVTTLPVGSYTLKVTVTDSRNLTATQAQNFEVRTNPSKSLRVSAVTYTTTVDSSGQRVVRISIAVRNGNNALVSGVPLTVQVSVGSRFLGSARNTTGSLGLARFAVNRAPLGCYVTKTTLEPPTGYVWDKAKDTLAINSCGTTVSQEGGAASTPGQDSPVQNSPSQTELRAVQGG